MHSGGRKCGYTSPRLHRYTRLSIDHFFYLSPLSDRPTDRLTDRPTDLPMTGQSLCLCRSNANYRIVYVVQWLLAKGVNFFVLALGPCLMVVVAVIVSFFI